MSTYTRNMPNNRCSVNGMHLLTLSACTTGLITVLEAAIGLCVSVCVSVNTLVTTYLVWMSEVRHHRIACKLSGFC